MISMLLACQAAFFPDFVLLLDADEFVSTRDRAQLLAALAAIPSGGVGLLPWRTYVISPDEQDRAEDSLRAMRWRRRREVPQYWKAAIHLDGAYRPDLEVAQGNHLVSSVAGEVPTVPVADLAVLHFPVRSKAQIISKAVVGWAAYLARNPEAREQDLGFQWREAFDRVASDDDWIGKVDLPGLAMNYAQSRSTMDWQADAVEDPPPLDVRRRYSTGRFTRPLALIARSWERSLAGAQSLVKVAKPTVAGDLAGVAATTFDADWHWSNLFVDVPPFRFLIEKYQPGSALDIGCGIGAYLRLAKALGVREVYGVDGVPASSTALDPGEYLMHDLSLPVRLDRAFDLVLCVEVAEHLSPRHDDLLIDSVARHARDLIVFSAAEPGQPGRGHINCQPIDYWLRKWAERGWSAQLIDSLGMRSLATLAWFRRNLVVLRRTEETTHHSANDLLADIGAKKFAWYDQVPGIRDRPFCEPLPTARCGYG